MEIGVIENNSIFNRHLDEILYFFQVTKYDVVIIEDLDRFGTPNIFLKLRELNQLINESKIVNRHIIFIYAVKDDIFKDEDRTKFFDYIIPIIPIINPSNSIAKLRSALKENECGDEISDEDLSEMSIFIQDMRILTNIINEYKQYEDRLCTTNGAQLNKTKLFAMIVYKNYYPQDFALLHRRQGKIYSCINSKSQLIKEALKNIEIKKHELDNTEKLYLENSHLKTTELRLLLLYKWKKTISESLYAINIDNNFYDLEHISGDDDLFTKLLSLTSINYRNYKYSGYNPLSSENNIESFIRKNGFKERFETAKYDKAYFKSKHDEIQIEIKQIKSLLIKDLLRKYHLGETNTYQNLELPSMLDIFIRQGYIDEEYYDYISYFYPEMVSLEDREFLLNIKRQIEQPYDYHIDRIKNVVKELKEYMFESDAILNIELLDYLATAEEYKDKFEHIMSRLQRKNAPLQFLSQYYIEGKQGEIVFKHYMENTNAWSNIICWQNNEERDNLIEAYLKYSGELGDIAQEWLNNHFEFLVNHVSGITLDRTLSLISDSCFVDLCEGSDDLLDCCIEYNSFSINLNNLFLVTKQLYKNNTTFSRNNLNFTRIKKSNNINLIKYIEENISIAIQIFKDDLKDESSECILYLLNSEKVDHNTKKTYLEGQKNKVESFELINNANLYDIAIETKIMNPTWENISFYITYKGSITDLVIEFIKYYVDILSKKEYSLNHKDNLYVSLLKSSKIDIEDAKNILQSFKGEFPKIDELGSLSNEKLQLLIIYERVPFNEQILSIINNTNVLVEYIITHSNDFIKNLGWDYKFNSQNAYEILNQEVFSTEEKYSIIGIIPPDLIKSSQILANLVIRIFYDKKELNIPLDSFLGILRICDDEITKTQLIIELLRNKPYDDEVVEGMILSIKDENIKEICNRNKRAKLSNNTINEQLLMTLENKGFISSYRFENNNKYLRVYHRANG